MSVSTDESILPALVLAALNEHGLVYEVVVCDATLADTADFCAHYGYSLDDSANAILIGAKSGDAKHALCVLLATTRLDTNKVARKKLGARRVSFADPELTRELTGMELGGVTPFGIPEELPLWIDARVMTRERVILGGGNRESKIVMSPGELVKLPGAEVVDDLAKWPTGVTTAPLKESSSKPPA